MEHGEQHTPAGPVFVGGTGRCGTHVVASLVGRSDRYAPVPAELRLHVDPGGLPGFVGGAQSRRRLLKALRTHWWRHRPPWAAVAEDRSAPATRGVHRISPRRRYLAARARLAASPPGADRAALSRRLISDLLDPLAPAPGAWVEKSPDNCAAAGFLHRLFPALRLIHVIRDGRDVACSFMRVPWAPDDFALALALWERRLLDAYRGTLELPAERVHRLSLEGLVEFDRERSYRGLIEFLQIPDDPALRSFFDRELTPARASIGRWRSDLHPSDHEAADSLYRASLERLAAAGVAPLPAADRPAARSAQLGREPSPIDPWAATTAGAT